MFIHIKLLPHFNNLNNKLHYEGIKLVGFIYFIVLIEFGCTAYS